MEKNEKKLIQLRTKLEFCKKLDNKIEEIIGDTLDIVDYSEEVYNEIQSISNELLDLKIEMNLSDEEWDEDAN